MNRKFSQQNINVTKLVLQNLERNIQTVNVTSGTPPRATASNSASTSHTYFINLSPNSQRDINLKTTK